MAKFAEMVRVQREIKKRLDEQRVEETRLALKEEKDATSIKEKPAKAVDTKTHNMPGKPKGPKHQGPETAKGSRGDAVKTHVRFMPGQPTRGEAKGPESVREKKGDAPKVKVRFMPKGVKTASTQGPESVEEKKGKGVDTKTRFRPSLPKGTPKKGPETVKEKPGSRAKLEGRRRPLTESFMEKVVYEDFAFEVESDGGTQIVPVDFVGSLGLAEGQSVTPESEGFDQIVDALSEFFEGPAGNVHSVTLRKGWLARMSAPGYMDATDWMIFDTEEEANEELDRLYGDDEEGDGRVPGEDFDSVMLRLEDEYPEMSEAGREKIARASVSDMTYDEYLEVIHEVKDDEGLDENFEEARRSRRPFRKGVKESVRAKKEGRLPTFIIKDNGGRYYRAEIDDWTVAFEAATEYAGPSELPDTIVGGTLELWRYGEDSRYYPVGSEDDTSEAAWAVYKESRRHRRRPLTESVPGAEIIQSTTAPGEDTEVILWKRAKGYGTHLRRVGDRPDDWYAGHYFEAFGDTTLEDAKRQAEEDYQERVSRLQWKMGPFTEARRRRRARKAESRRSMKEGIAPQEIKERLEYLRGEIQADQISYEEIAELQSLAEYIDPSDVELLGWAGVPEFPDEENEKEVARQMQEKGYTYFLKMKDSDRYLFFKTAAEIGPFLREDQKGVAEAMGPISMLVESMTEAVVEACGDKKKLVEAPEDDEFEEPAEEEGEIVAEEEPEGDAPAEDFSGEDVPEELPPTGEEEEVPEGEEEPSIEDREPEVFAPEDSPREWNPGDTALFDYGEGPTQVKVADGDDDRPFRKEGQLWGDEQVPRTYYLVSFVDPETGKTVEFYAASFLLK